MTGTISIDFDGVIHKYSKGWHDGTIYDDPVPGTLEALSYLMKGYAIVIYTTRDPAQVVPWLEKFGIPAIRLSQLEKGMEFWNEKGTILVSQKKIPSLVYIDDRALRFTSWDQAIADLAKLSFFPNPGDQEKK